MASTSNDLLNLPLDQIIKMQKGSGGRKQNNRANRESNRGRRSRGITSKFTSSRSTKYSQGAGSIFKKAFDDLKGNKNRSNNDMDVEGSFSTTTTRSDPDDPWKHDLFEDQDDTRNNQTTSVVTQTQEGTKLDISGLSYEVMENDLKVIRETKYLFFSFQLLLNEKIIDFFFFG
jgi:hypothetical protein